jgi:hypothetical protein
MSGAVTGSSNTCIGAGSSSSLLAGNNNTFIGFDAGATTTNGSSNICIGRNAAASGALNSNDISIGSLAYWVGTDTAANTYFTGATALSTGVLPATCGFFRIYINGTARKIPVYAV